MRLKAAYRHLPGTLHQSEDRESRPPRLEFSPHILPPHDFPVGLLHWFHTAHATEFPLKLRPAGFHLKYRVFLHWIKRALNHPRRLLRSAFRPALYIPALTVRSPSGRIDSFFPLRIFAVFHLLSAAFPLIFCYAPRGLQTFAFQWWRGCFPNAVLWWFRSFSDGFPSALSFPRPSDS